jgi:transposase
VIRAAEQDRPDVAAQREHWRTEVMPKLDPEHVIFIDETGAKSNMTRSHGYAPKGERLVDAVPHGHWNTTTVVGALRSDGMIAPMVVDGSLNGELFLAYVRQVLVPELRPGDVVVMDNLASHHVAGVEESIRAAGGRLEYLPPYSPDFNPIENAFSKLKRLLRAAAARTQEALWGTIGWALNQFAAQECKNYFNHCGYAATLT